MSGTNSATMRYRRVYTQGVPELGRALDAGLLTPYRAGEIARLEPEAQQSALKIWTERTLVHTQAQASAAVALRQHLANNSSSKVALQPPCW
jgi:hypothetical protein